MVVIGNWPAHKHVFPSSPRFCELAIDQGCPANSARMTAKAVLLCRPNSHPFQDRTLLLDQSVKIGRSVARARPAPNNAIFDCKVLSRNHALLWYENGKFYLQDTKSSNGTFVNNQRLSKGSEESTPREVCSSDIVQFGVDVMENSRKVTHGCIVATLKLYLPDGKEAKASASTAVGAFGSLPTEELYQIHHYIKEAMAREQLLENKLATLQRIISTTKDSADNNWRALIEEDRLLTRIEDLERQLQLANKNIPDDLLRDEVKKYQLEQEKYQEAAKETIRKLIQEKSDILQKYHDSQRMLSNAEDETNLLKDLNEKLKADCVESIRQMRISSEKFQELLTKHEEEQQKHYIEENNVVNEDENNKEEVIVEEDSGETKKDVVAEAENKSEKEREDLEENIKEIDECAALQQRLEMLQLESSVSAGKLTALQTRMSDAKLEIQRKTFSITNLESEIQHLKNSLENKNEEVKANDNEKERTLKLRKELDTSKELLHEERASKVALETTIAALKGEIQLRNDEAERYQKEIKLLKDRFQHIIETQNFVDEEQLTLHQNLQKELAKLQSIVNEETKLKTIATEEIGKLHKILQQTQLSSKQDKQELEKIKELNIKLQAEIEQWKIVTTEKSEKEAELMKRKEECENLQSMVTILENNVKSLKAANSVLEQKNKKIQVLIQPNENNQVKELNNLSLPEDSEDLVNSLVQSKRYLYSCQQRKIELANDNDLLREENKKLKQKSNMITIFGTSIFILIIAIFFTYGNSLRS